MTVKLQHDGVTVELKADPSHPCINIYVEGKLFAWVWRDGVVSIGAQVIVK